MTTGRKTRRPTQTCPECGANMRHETRDDKIAYKGQTRSIRTEGWWCTNCDEAIFEAPALQAAEKAFVELRAEVDQILRPEEVKAVRQSLQISQREASRVLGGGPRAFQKYERGTVPVSVPMSHLLVLLKNDPSRLAELTKKKPPAGATVKKVASLPQARKRVRRTSGSTPRRPAHACAPWEY